MSPDLPELAEMGIWLHGETVCLMLYKKCTNRKNKTKTYLNETN